MGGDFPARFRNPLNQIRHLLCNIRCTLSAVDIRYKLLLYFSNKTQLNQEKLTAQNRSCRTVDFVQFVCPEQIETNAKMLLRV